MTIDPKEARRCRLRSLHRHPVFPPFPRGQRQSSWPHASTRRRRKGLSFPKGSDSSFQLRPLLPETRRIPRSLLLFRSQGAITKKKYLKGNSQKALDLDLCDGRIRICIRAMETRQSRRIKTAFDTQVNTRLTSFRLLDCPFRTVPRNQQTAQATWEESLLINRVYCQVN